MKVWSRFSKSLQVGRHFTSDLKGHGPGLAGVLVLLLATVGLELLRPWPLRWIIDGALLPTGPIPADATRIVLEAAGVLTLILLVKAAAEYFATLRLTAIGHQVTRAIRLRIFRHLVELPPEFHSRNKSGDLLVRLLGDVAMVKEMLVDAYVQIGVRSVHAIGIVGVMLWIDPVLAMSVLVPLPVLGWSVRALSNRLRIAVRKQRRKEGVMANYMHEAIAATPMVQSLGSGGYIVRQFAQTNRRNARAGLKTARAEARMTCTVEMLLAVAFAATMVFGGLRVISGHLSAGELIAFLSYVRSFLKPIRAAAKHQGRIAKGTASGERILEVLDQGLELRETAGQRSPSDHPEKLTFSGVEYTYSNGARALRGVNLECKRGRITALIGPSGSGKSTLVSLALRLFDPSAGSISIDGVSLKEMDLDKLRQSFALSMQKTVLLGESIRENLLLGAHAASEAEMWAAIERAGLGRALLELPEGLETVLGSAGVGLSGGESRRLCFARALLRKAPILVVDEPFAGLDKDTATLVAETLRQESAERIVLIITHHVEYLGCSTEEVHLRDGLIERRSNGFIPREVCG